MLIQLSILRYILLLIWPYLNWPQLISNHHGIIVLTACAVRQVLTHAHRAWVCTPSIFEIMSTRHGWQMSNMSTRHGWQMSNMGYQLNTPSPPPLFPRIYIAKLIVLTFQIESFQMILYLLLYIWCNIQGFLTQNKFPHIFYFQHFGRREKDEQNLVPISILRDYSFFYVAICSHLIVTFSFLSLIHYQEKAVVLKNIGMHFSVQ